MKQKVFFDTNIFIWAFNRPESNSAKVLELADENKINAFVSEKVVEELEKYFKTYHNERVWFAIYTHLRSIATIVPRKQIIQEIFRWKNSIKEKDIEHVATVKLLEIKTLISLDRDYKNFPEYITPKKFVEKIGLKAKKMEY